MTDLMTVLPVILVEASYPGYLSAKGVQFQSTCHLCRESHKTQVWLCFLVLSLLSTCTYADAREPYLHMQNCLGTDLKKAIEKSDAMLYAPSADEVKEKCKKMSLKCYILELLMVINEEGFQDKKATCVWDFNKNLNKDNEASAPSVDCPPCETYSLKNITVFLERLNSLLQELYSMQT
ncbi:uncharacterized protein ACO6RY_19840 [Pungitius sinensis]